jgi:4-hydroxybenzoate polyprenyltransferase
MISFKNNVKPVTFTLIGMAIIVLVFYPLFFKLESWIKNFSVKVVRSGRSLAGKYLGLTLSFVCCLLVLGYFYAKMWYHIDLLNILMHWNIEGYH